MPQEISDTQEYDFFAIVDPDSLIGVLHKLRKRCLSPSALISLYLHIKSGIPIHEQSGSAVIKNSLSVVPPLHHSPGDSKICHQGTFIALWLPKPDHTANPSKLIEKNFLDLRNMFTNQENNRIFFSKQEI